MGQENTGAGPGPTGAGEEIPESSLLRSEAGEDFSTRVFAPFGRACGAYPAVAPPPESSGPDAPSPTVRGTNRRRCPVRLRAAEVAGTSPIRGAAPPRKPDGG